MNKKQPQKVQKVTYLLKKGFKMHTFPYVCATFTPPHSTQIVAKKIAYTMSKDRHFTEEQS